MNYLGHAYLSMGDSAVVAGNMIGDHVKGTLALAAFPGGMQAGIRLHRRIDEFADMHPATLRAKILFKEHYGLYAGAIMDTLYDHFLANDPKLFAGEKELKAFATHTYAQVEEYAAHLPPPFAAYFPHMKEHDWLYNYRTMKGIERSLQRLHRRAKHMPPPGKAYEIFVTNYYHLNQCYFELIDDIVSFARKELGK